MPHNGAAFKAHPPRGSLADLCPSRRERPLGNIHCGQQPTMIPPSEEKANHHFASRLIPPSRSAFQSKPGS
jgi:hypothetical protein